jgi:hypothetical protein
MQVDVWRQRVTFGAFQSELNREPNCRAAEMTLAALSTEMGWRFGETVLYLSGDHSLELHNDEADGPIEDWLWSGWFLFGIVLIAIVALVVAALVATARSRRKGAWLGGAFVTGLVLAWALGFLLLLRQMA